MQLIESKKSRIIFDEPEATVDGLQTAPSADPDGRRRLLEPMSLQKHEFNHFEYHTELESADWSQVIENYLRQT